MTYGAQILRDNLKLTKERIVFRLQHLPVKGFIFPEVFRRKRLEVFRRTKTYFFKNLFKQTIAISKIFRYNYIEVRGYGLFVLEKNLLKVLKEKRSK